MSQLRPTRTLLVIGLFAVAAPAGLLALSAVGNARVGGVHVATSVCEAHELKARAAEDPHFEIEIPTEFDVPFPTRSACLSYAAASDPDAPGPLQPIPFSHKHHAGTYQINCLYCHSGTDRSQTAGMPPLDLCMGCHLQFLPTYDEFAGIRTLKDHWKRQEPIAWEQIYRTPEYVQFRHNRHVQAGVTCQQCHGPVETMDKLYMTPDTKWWPWGLPTAKLEMGWCITCHRQQVASQDCTLCHY